MRSSHGRPIRRKSRAFRVESLEDRLPLSGIDVLTGTAALPAADEVRLSQAITAEGLTGAEVADIRHELERILASIVRIAEGQAAVGTTDAAPASPDPASGTPSLPAASSLEAPARPDVLRTGGIESLLTALRGLVDPVLLPGTSSTPEGSGLGPSAVPVPAANGREPLLPVNHEPFATAPGWILPGSSVTDRTVENLIDSGDRPSATDLALFMAIFRVQTEGWNPAKVVQLDVLAVPATMGVQDVADEDVRLVHEEIIRALREGEPGIPAVVTNGDGSSPSAVEVDLSRGAVAEHPARYAVVAEGGPRPPEGPAPAVVEDGGGWSPQSGREEAGPAAVDPPDATSEADLLASFSPFDRGGIERAIDQLLDGLGDLDEALASLGETTNLIPEGVAAGAALVAVEVARRKLRKRSAGGAVPGEDDPSSPGLPGYWAMGE